MKSVYKQVYERLMYYDSEGIYGLIGDNLIHIIWERAYWHSGYTDESYVKSKLGYYTEKGGTGLWS